MATIINKSIASGRADYAYKCVKEDVVEVKYKPYLEEIWDKIAKKEIYKIIDDSKIFNKKEDKQEFTNKIFEAYKSKVLNDLKNYIETKNINTQNLNLNFSSVDNLVNDVENLIKNEIIRSQGEYKSYVKKIPMLIKNNGLAATFAFVLSKNSKIAYQIIYNQTENWLIQHRKLINSDLMESILDKNSSDYRVLTNEVLALFNWMRRFADGLIVD